MNSRWQAGKIGLINFWYYDEQEFPFVKGRMLLRGSNGSGKSVTMQSVVPLLLDGNMSPERLDPFGSRDRKMSSYLLEENDGREERTGYLYLEFKRKDSDIYFTIGMGIRARRGKPLDKWYFSLTDGRRVGKDFFLYKDMGEKVTLSRRELEYRVADGGKVFDRQVEYMDYVNRQIFGFETLDEYKEMLDLLIQLRTPKLSKDFKPSVINDILSDSLQPLSDEDLRPMSEAIENMDTMNMNLKSRREARQAAEKIHVIYHKYNKLLLWDKAKDFLQRAFTIIFVATIIIWFLQTFDTRLNVVMDSANSLLAVLGRWVAPIFTPLGFGDWRISTSLITGFTAKEAVVSTMSVLCGTSMSNLPQTLGSFFTPLSAVSFLVFTLLYTPCVAAIAAIRREMDSALQAVGIVIMQCVIAWLVAFGVYRIGSLL